MCALLIDLPVIEKEYLLLLGKRTIFIPVSKSESPGDRDSTNKSSLFCMSIDNKGKC